MSKALHILGKDIAPGSKCQINLDIARLHTRTKLEVPVIIERAKKEGPCLLFLAGIHGNELNGVEIVRQIISQGINKPTAGTVICIPVLNVFGFLNQTREFPDGRDLNRVFPGTKTGSLASRFAYHFMQEIVPHIDYGVDFHTGGASRFNYSQVRIDPKDEECRRLAETFGAGFIINAPQREKSFRESSARLGKKVLLFEGGKSLYLDRKVTQIGLLGAKRIMQYLGMRDFSTSLATAPPLTESILISSSKWVRAKHSGMYRSFISLGSKVSKNDVLGSITDPYGDFTHKVLAPMDAYIICSNHSPIVNQGDAIIHLGTNKN
ncbi:MAG: succinylglutamate desuccinylase/aspartoacylase family protein [Bacteroidia bacterium]